MKCQVLVPLKCNRKKKKKNRMSSATILLGTLRVDEIHVDVFMKNDIAHKKFANLL